MTAEGRCLNCGVPLGLVQRVTGDHTIEVRGKGEICPQCYRSLSQEERLNYFGN